MATNDTIDLTSTQLAELQPLLSVKAALPIDPCGSAFVLTLVIGGELASLVREMANDDPELPLREAAECVLDSLAHPLQPTESFELGELAEDRRRRQDLYADVLDELSREAA